MRSVTAILVNHDHGDEARETILSLGRLPDRVPVRLVLVDNVSRDGVADWVAEAIPDAIVLRNTARHGFARNVNAGLRQAPAEDDVLLLNPDVGCLPGLLDHLVAALDAAPDVGIAGPMLLNPDGTIQPSCRRFSTPSGLVLRGLHLDLLLGRISAVRRYLMTDFDHRSAADVDWVTGALMLVRRAALAQVGVLDERYFLYAEDQDLCCRMWRAGWRVRYEPRAQAVHAHRREGMTRPWSRHGRYQVASALQMLVKFRGRLTRQA